MSCSAQCPSEATYQATLLSHYTAAWGLPARALRWTLGPTHEVPSTFSVAEFAPGPERAAWTYATCGMSGWSDASPTEVHLFSPVQVESHIELLTALAHFHRTGAPLAVGHTVNFGRPWLPGSGCTRGLLSLPYLDGPKLEVAKPRPDAPPIRCAWLIPVFEEEVAFKKANGLEALEARFEETGFDYLDPGRASVVPCSQVRGAIKPRGA